MTKRWTESDLRFIKDNAGKMSVQGLADALDSRIDELERKMEKLGLTGAAGTPAAKKALTLKELSRHTENARKDFDRGIGALQKKRFDEAERNLALDLIQKYPDEKELVDRARVYLSRSASGRRWPPGRRSSSRGPVLRGRARKPGQRLRGDRAPEARGEEERRRPGGFPARLLLPQSGDPGTALEHLKKAIEEDQRHRVLARHDRDFDPVATPGIPGPPGLLTVAPVGCWWADKSCPSVRLRGHQDSSEASACLRRAGLLK
jgi:hypothetical protein